MLSYSSTSNAARKVTTFVGRIARLSLVCDKRARRGKTIGVLMVIALLVIGWLALGQGSSRHALSGHSPVSRAMANRWQQLADRGVAEEKSVFGPVPWQFSALGHTANKMSLREIHAAEHTLADSWPLRLHFEHARYLAARGKIGLWVVRGRGVICMFRMNRSGSVCDTSANVAQKGLLLEVYVSGPPPQRQSMHYLALGIAPDWAKRVWVEAGGGLEEIPINDNCYRVRANSPIQVDRLSD